MCSNRNCECNTSDTSCNVRDGRDGKHGLRGHKGEKGDKGDRGEKGERGEKCDTNKCNSHCDREHSCNCKKYLIDFSRVCNTDETKIIHIVSNIIFVIYGYILNTECSMIKHPLKVNKYGIVCSNTHTVQIDLGDYIRLKNMKCLDPKIKIGRIEKYEKVIVWGSNTLGTLGKELYTYINNTCDEDYELTIPSFDTVNLTKTGDIYLYGSLPFRYISITSCNSSITLDSLTIYVPS